MICICSFSLAIYVLKEGNSSFVIYSEVSTLRFARMGRIVKGRLASQECPFFVVKQIVFPLKHLFMLVLPVLGSQRLVGIICLHMEIIKCDLGMSPQRDIFPICNLFTKWMEGFWYFHIISIRKPAPIYIFKVAKVLFIMVAFEGVTKSPTMPHGMSQFTLILKLLG